MSNPPCIWGDHTQLLCQLWTTPGNAAPTSLKVSQYFLDTKDKPRGVFYCPRFPIISSLSRDCSLQIGITKFSTGFHLIFILNSSNSFICTERLYENDMKDVKAFADQRGNLLKVDFHKIFLSICGFRKPLGFSFRAKATNTHQKPVHLEGVIVWTIMTIVSFLQIVLLLTLQSCPMERGLKVDQKALQYSARHMVNLT